MKYLTEHRDERGSFTEIFRTILDNIVQVNLSISRPGIVRAWHRHQHQNDYICVIQGKAKICVFDGVNIKEIFVSGAKKQVIYVPRNTWHGTKNIGKKNSLTLYGQTSQYNPKYPDEERLEQIYIEKGKIYEW